MNSSSSNTLRVGVGESSSHEVSLSLPKLKAKKGYIEQDYHGFFIENGAIRRFTTYSGKRYVHAQPIVFRKCLTTISGVS